MIRRFLQIAIALCMQLCLQPLQVSADPPLRESSKPNILLIVAEDYGPEMGCYGDAFAKTPNLDQLAKQGIRFERAFVPQAGCSQSRASFLTGRYPHQHGQIGLATWGFRLYRSEIESIPKSLSRIGYATGIIGKLHVEPESAIPFDSHDIPASNFNRKNLRDYAKKADAFIAKSQQAEKPFFLSVNFPDAHDPWIRQVDGLPAQPQNAQDVRAMPYMGIDPAGMRPLIADYYNCISRLDSLVGELLLVLEKRGSSENTLVIFIGDHGADMLRGKRTCFEGGLRIPMLLRWPGKISPQVRNELVSTLDLFPTILRTAGAEALEGLAGMELQPLFDPSNSRPTPWRSHYFAEYHTHAAASNYFPQRCVRSDRYKLIENLLPDTIHPDYANTIRKLVEDTEQRGVEPKLDLHEEIANAPEAIRNAYELARKPPKYQLYDLQEDPFEFRNLADSSDHAQILKDLSERLNRWRQESQDPLLDPENLRKLTAEVQSVKKKAVAKDLQWDYIDYFFEAKR
jgi:N-sulfoglucosamine sulfohydrolase